MKKISPLNYAFAVGKIRAREKFLIRQEVFEEAIESGLSEALRLFTESDLYSDELLHVRTSQGLEEVLKEELLKLKSLMQGLILDKDLLGLLESDYLKCAEYLLRSLPSGFLKEYLMHLIDMHNIKTYLRLYILKEPPEKLKNLLVDRGFIPQEVFLNLYDQDLAVFSSRLEYVHKYNQIMDYAAFLQPAIERLKKENSFVALEKAINDFLVQILKPAKFICFGPEPILAYYFAKVNEMNLIRLIILAKLNDVSKELVKERLNAVYA